MHFKPHIEDLAIISKFNYIIISLLLPSPCRVLYSNNKYLLVTMNDGAARSIEATGQMGTNFVMSL